MKLRTLGTLALLCVGLYSCQTEEIEATIGSDEAFVTVNLETFVAQEDLDDSPRGKYVGVMGHHTNPEIHGKIFMNSGQHNQYNALVNMTNGTTLKFKGTPQTKDGSIVFYEGDSASFIANFQSSENQTISSVQFQDELTDGYVVLQKSTKGVDAVVLTGTYVDSANPAFTGNWNLMGDGTVTDVDVPVVVPGLGTIIVSVPTENIGMLVVTHTGSTMPITDSAFETNAALPCIEAAIGPGFSNMPFIIPSSIPNPLPFGDPLGGEGSISAGGQTSLLNGSDASWSLSFGAPIPAAMIDGGFSDDNCMPATSGTWSWNGRTGTIGIDGL